MCASMCVCEFKSGDTPFPVCYNPHIHHNPFFFVSVNITKSALFKHNMLSEKLDIEYSSEISKK